MKKSGLSTARAVTSSIPWGLIAAAVVGIATSPRSKSPETLGDHLRSTRRTAGLTLRDVEAETKISNGYLSQIESNRVTSPSPNMLHKLASVYGLDYTDLLVRAGHHVPTTNPEHDQVRKLAGIPLRALEELDEAEAAELRNYLAFLRQKRRDRQTT
ncbi:helix-turn-helix transcriptional regulator (plasmid) [Clavibacter capsici]|uniref:Helix-turn-helix transcriptional regulator n=1 Tax=Clavibacter capsici TaxID=1874630 RepID=A0AAE6XTF7_9MICO|nr:helix-turn-helix transcriptional regulator [Clavibacter capsici]QIS40548.1 helix-turn-helix transcriptional regulator [Clavibacter capsici]QIS43521.1 helix-turn-helix transcriptional regulator [Clavibacter capsici]QIS46433.1 helix-turn-helix transcriptional regulator [Clavibacter capsici]